MLNITQLTDGQYICNWCGNIYNLADATRAKGNQFLCSMKCVLDYSELNDHEKIREGE